MTPETLSRLRTLAAATAQKIDALREAIDAVATDPAGPPPFPPVAPVAPPRAVLTIGSASAQKGKEATVALRLTAPFPVAGAWLNIRSSPRLAFLSATSKVKSRAFRVEKGEDHFRALIMFSSNLETGSAGPGEGLVQLDPETLILEATYRAPADGTPGQKFVIQQGFSGAATPGVSQVSWPSILLDWGQGTREGGGKTYDFVDGYVEILP